MHGTIPEHTIVSNGGYRSHLSSEKYNNSSQALSMPETARPIAKETVISTSSDISPSPSPLQIG